MDKIAAWKDCHILEIRWLLRVNINKEELERVQHYNSSNKNTLRQKLH